MHWIHDGSILKPGGRKFKREGGEGSKKGKRGTNGCQGYQGYFFSWIFSVKFWNIGLTLTALLEDYYFIWLLYQALNFFSGYKVENLWWTLLRFLLLKFAVRYSTQLSIYVIHFYDNIAQ